MYIISTPAYLLFALYFVYRAVAHYSRIEANAVDGSDKEAERHLVAFMRNSILAIVSLTLLLLSVAWDSSL
jgi:hypothetical protein